MSPISVAVLALAVFFVGVAAGIAIGFWLGSDA